MYILCIYFVLSYFYLGLSFYNSISASKYKYSFFKSLRSITNSLLLTLDIKLCLNGDQFEYEVWMYLFIFTYFIYFFINQTSWYQINERMHLKWLVCEFLVFAIIPEVLIPLQQKVFATQFRILLQGENTFS